MPDLSVLTTRNILLHRKTDHRLTLYIFCIHTCFCIISPQLGYIQTINNINGMQKMHRLDVHMSTLNISLFIHKTVYMTLVSFRNLHCHFFTKTIHGTKDEKPMIWLINIKKFIHNISPHLTICIVLCGLTFVHT